MDDDQRRGHKRRDATLWEKTRQAPMLISGSVALILASVTPAASLQQAAPTAASLVFDKVTVVDVEQGKLVPDQRVVIVGNRIQAVGGVGAVKLPGGARVVDAKGKYLIPGLWDMHVHVMCYPQIFYPLFIANGITGIRDMGSTEPLDSMARWRHEIAVGKRVGPRTVIAGPALYGTSGGDRGCGNRSHFLAVTTLTQARRVVDSLKSAGADFIKVYWVELDVYYAVAAEARRVGIPFAGHEPNPFQQGATVFDAADSGQHSIEHVALSGGWGTCLAQGEVYPGNAAAYAALRASWRIAAESLQARNGAGKEPQSDTGCAALAAHFVRNDTWLTPTLTTEYDTLRRRRYWPAVVLQQWPSTSTPDDSMATSFLPTVKMAVRAGIPMLAGSDAAPGFMGPTPGFSLHDELELLFDAGMVPLQVLQAATLNPARYLHAGDSLGSVAASKLADLVLLDANPLVDIRNTRTIRAVVANGRYYDRAALDGLLRGVEAKAKQP